MEMTELMGRLGNSKSAEETYVLLSLIGEAVETQKEELKASFTLEQPRSVPFPELGKTFNIMEIKKNTLDVKAIKEKMTDEEIRTVYKPTDKDLQLLKREDLRELKEVSTQKQVRVTSLVSA